MSIECWGNIDQDVESVYWDVIWLLVKMLINGIDGYFTADTFSAHNPYFPPKKHKISKFQFDQDRITLSKYCYSNIFLSLFNIYKLIR